MKSQEPGIQLDTILKGNQVSQILKQKRAKREKNTYQSSFHFLHKLFTLKIPKNLRRGRALSLQFLLADLLLPTPDQIRIKVDDFDGVLDLWYNRLLDCGEIDPNSSPRAPFLENLPAEIRRRVGASDLRELGLEALHELELGRRRGRRRRRLEGGGGVEEVLELAEGGEILEGGGAGPHKLQIGAGRVPDLAPPAREEG